MATAGPGQVAAILGWYAVHARDLPWRRPTATPWGVLVSEFMLQQTPVARVLPAYQAWLARWPDPPALAAAGPADAVRQWGRLGYPRRAIRLHAAAQVISDRHGGQVPSSIDALGQLPGVGPYTATAVASFAFGQRHPVLDTNVRRVLARMRAGQQWPARSTTAAEVALARSLLPDRPELAARWSVAVMELGALVCSAARPRCGSCPVAGSCAWRLAGSPATPGRRASQPYQGTDRQCRGRLLAVLRDADGPVPPARLDAAWPDHRQRARALASLIADGLATEHPGGGYSLPGSSLLPDLTHRLERRLRDLGGEGAGDGGGAAGDVELLVDVFQVGAQLVLPGVSRGTGARRRSESQVGLLQVRAQQHQQRPVTLGEVRARCAAATSTR